MPILVSPRTTLLAALLCASTVGGGCLGADSESSSDDSVDGSDEVGEASAALSGRELFEEETFGGNGRSCETCHSKKNGTLTLEQIDKLFRTKPSAPLFRSIDSDDGVGNSYSRLRTNGTIRVTIPLPPNIRLGDDPTATSVVLERGIPTTTNVATAEFMPNVDGRVFLDYDFRADSLESQAAGAIAAHFQNTSGPSESQLHKIAEFERNDDRFFSSNKIHKWVDGEGPAPELPKANTAAQKRGRKFFEPGGRCEGCHSGPLLNRTTESEIFQPVGSQWSTAFAGELLPDQMPQPTREWVLSYEPGEVPAGDCEFLFGTVDQDAGTCSVWIPDPLRMLITGDLADFGAVKIPTLWGVNETAPYFHDNSAKDLPAVLRQYNEYFTLFGNGPLPPADQADIIAFLKLL